MKKRDLLNLRGELTRIAAVMQQLKALPNCYSCAKEDCEHRLVDDSMPSRYNCPLYVRDENKPLVENC